MSNVKTKLDLNEVYFHGFNSRSKQIVSQSDYIKLMVALELGILSYNKRLKNSPYKSGPGVYSASDFVCIANKYVDFDRQNIINGAFRSFSFNHPSIIISRDIESIETFQQHSDIEWRVKDLIPKEYFVGIGVPHSHLGYCDSRLLRIYEMILKNANINLPLYDTTTEECLIKSFKRFKRNSLIR